MTSATGMPVVLFTGRPRGRDTACAPRRTFTTINALPHVGFTDDAPLASAAGSTGVADDATAKGSVAPVSPSKELRRSADVAGRGMPVEPITSSVGYLCFFVTAPATPLDERPFPVRPNIGATTRSPTATSAAALGCIAALCPSAPWVATGPPHAAAMAERIGARVATETTAAVRRTVSERAAGPASDRESFALPFDLRS